MKYGIVAASFLLFLTGVINAQDKNISGSWKGKLDVMGSKLTIVFNIESKGEELKATMDSPDQGAYGIKVDAVTVKEGKAKIKVNMINGVYEGRLINADSLAGLWKQNSREFDLNLKKAELKKNGRPQNPEKPYPYEEEEVLFENDEGGASLSGTLTYPKGEGKFPAVILVSGSGLQDRDESLMGHKPFLVLSDYLTRRGIAVLRYDDRGCGKSKGDAVNATSIEFAQDAAVGIEYLRAHSKIDAAKVGIIGHSEGGYIAPMIASGDEEVAFIVMLAGPGIQGKDIIYQQVELLLNASGFDTEFVKKYMSALDKILTILVTENNDLKKNKLVNFEINRFTNSLSDKEKEILNSNNLQMEGKLQQLIIPWTDFFLKYDPAVSISETRCPVLALIGEKDLQVPAKTNIAPIKKALSKAGNKDYTVMELKGLNHLFQECETGAMTEYGKIEQTFSPAALELITKWILERTGGNKNE